MRYQAALPSDKNEIIAYFLIPAQSKVSGSRDKPEAAARSRPLPVQTKNLSTTQRRHSMNLILWRHAEAEDQAASDLVRPLTGRGVKQAQAAAKWLKSRIGDDAVFLVSPATRTIQTMEAFGDQYRVIKELAPGAGAQTVLDVVEWPRGIAETVVVVGHQPTL